MVKTIEAYHIPAMLSECISGLHINGDGVYVDVTFGGGGHSREILRHLGPKGKLYAFDQDNDAVRNLPDDERLVFINHNFKFISQFLEYLKAIPVDGILADLGISSYQINEGDKGFAHRLEGNLDMRMDKNAALSASNVVNIYTEDQLLKVFRKYGEISNAYKLVQTIIDVRKTNPIITISDFKNAIKNCIPGKEESKYLSQVFQALRIEVNEEMKALETLLTASTKLLRQGGRLVVISYHSLEDRLVKNFINSGNVEGIVEKDFYGQSNVPFKAITKKPMVPTDKEISENKRARSAKLRIAEKL